MVLIGPRFADQFLCLPMQEFGLYIQQQYCPSRLLFCIDHCKACSMISSISDYMIYQCRNLGDVSTNHHAVSLRVKSLLDSCNEGLDEHCNSGQCSTYPDEVEGNEVASALQVCPQNFLAAFLDAQENRPSPIPSPRAPLPPPAFWL